MVEIQWLSDKIKDEIHDAKDYAKTAIEWKEEFPEIARDLYNISLDEMKHMGMLHDAVAKMIEKYRKEEGEPPADMMARYEYLHKIHIDKAMKAKTFQTMFKEG